jgi:ABC-type phosphate/phosphonate transport system permease subunit
VYAGLLVAGVVLPFAQLVPWLVENGVDGGLFLDELFANRISSFFGWDVIVAVLVLLIVVTVVDSGLSRGQRALAVCGALLGASVGLPLYLLLRQRNLRVREGGEGGAARA